MATKTTNTTGIPTRAEIQAKARELREKRAVATVTTVSALTSVDTPVFTSTMTPALTSTMTPALTIETEALPLKETSMNTDLTPDALDEQTAEVERMLDRIEAADAERDALMAKRRAIEEQLREALKNVGEELRTVEQSRGELVAELADDYGAELTGSVLTEAKAQEVIDEVMAEVRRAAGEDADFLLMKLKIEDFAPTVDEGAGLPAATMERMEKLIIADCKDEGANTDELVRELREYVAERAGSVGVWGPALVAAVDGALLATCYWSPTPARKANQSKANQSKAKSPRVYIDGATTMVQLPGYDDPQGGVEAKVYIPASGGRKVTLGGRGIPAYLDRIGHHNRAAATVQLQRIADQWAKDAGYLTAK